MTAPLPPPGWYPDPGGANIQRYFDGTKWTDRLAPFNPPETPAPRMSSGNAATIVLVALHAVLVFFTLLLIFFLLGDTDPHDQCRIHNLHCDRGPHIREAALIGVVASAALIILELVLVTFAYLRKRQRRSFAVPLLCCIGQFIIICALVITGGE